jgi:glutaredoxin 3
MKSLPKHPKQANVLIYSKDFCPYCVAAANLLTQKGAGFEVIDVTKDHEQYKIMLEKSAPRRTVPQIFIDEQGMGGFDDIKQMDREGKLEQILFPSGR